MENGIKKILRDKYGLFEKDIEILLEKFTKFSVPKREIILQERQTDHYIYFVEKGIVKSTILREGREFIIFFALENDVPLSSPNLTESRQSLYTLEAVDTCILWRISRKMQALYLLLINQYIHICSKNSDFIGKTYTLISVSDSWIASLHRIEYVFCVPFPGALPLQYRPVSPFLSIIKYTFTSGMPYIFIRITPTLRRVFLFSLKYGERD